jgi:hypothetical protein
MSVLDYFKKQAPEEIKISVEVIDVEGNTIFGLPGRASSAMYFKVTDDFKLELELDYTPEEIGKEFIKFLEDSLYIAKTGKLKPINNY